MFYRPCTCLLTKFKREKLHRSMDVEAIVLSKDCPAECEVPSQAVDGEDVQLQAHNLCVLGCDHSQSVPRDRNAGFSF